MTQGQLALVYAKRACDTMMRNFAPAELPPVQKFHYHQGVFFSGMYHTYLVCREERYYDYMKQWVDNIVWEDGSIHDFDARMLDDIQPGILLFPLYERTGDKRYEIALETLMEVLRNWKCNEYGGFWHKEWHPNQMWLDGLYMAGPIQAKYAAVYKKPQYLETVIRQIFLMKDHLLCKRTGLLYHAWDASKKSDWADPLTGVSHEVWGRAMGWYVVALLDILEVMPKTHPRYGEITELEKRLLESLIKYQDGKSGMWYQIVDKGSRSDNWLETSCTALFAYSIARAVRYEILDKKYTDNVWRAFEGIIEHSVTQIGEDMQLNYICKGLDVTVYDTYVRAETGINDLHGMGAFLLMCAELAM